MEAVSPPPEPRPSRPPRLARRADELLARLPHPRLLATLLLLTLAGAAALGAASWQSCFFDGCPDVGRLAALAPAAAPVLLDRSGRPFGDLAPVAPERVPLHVLPQHVGQAFVSVEDKRFYEHRGLDLRRAVGAALADLRSGGLEEGFSTLSMQLARNLFPRRIPAEERTLRRKLLEIRVAQEIEERYTKDQILELYLNHIYFGNGAQGIEAAARHYFGIPARELDLPQAALLAALPKAPNRYDPRRDPERALARRNLVLTLMEQQGMIAPLEARAARQSPLGLSQTPRERAPQKVLAPYFVAEVRRQLEDRFGPALYEQPLLVHTTLDRGVQRAAEAALTVQLQAIEAGQLGRFDAPRDPGPGRRDPEADYLEGATVVLAAASGDVLAWVGGRDFELSQFDRVARAERQVGSAWKPFVYAAALATGHPLSEPLLDRPLTVRLANGRTWEPRDYRDEYDGRVSMRAALARSKNVPTVHLAQEIGLDRVIALARSLGIASPIPALPSTALGSVAATPLEMTSAYSAFASLGVRAAPRLVTKVERLDGTVLWQTKPAPRRVLDPGVAYLLDDALGSVLSEGTGAVVRRLGFDLPAAGKTGTTNDGADAWFIGYTPELAAGVWIGFDHPRPIAQDATGGALAAPVWTRMMQQVYAHRPAPAPWPQPAGVVREPIDPATGNALAARCRPSGGGAPQELFLARYAPAAVCPGESGAEAAPPVQVAAKGNEEAPEEQPPAQPEAQASSAAHAQAAAKDRQADQARQAAAEQAAARARADQAAEQAAARVRAAQAAEQAAEQARRDEAERRARDAAVAKLAAEQATARRDAARQARIAAQERAQAKRLADIQAREAAEARRERLAEADRERAARAEARARRDEETRRERAPAPDVIGDIDVTEGPSGPDLTGWWDITNEIESTSYPPYEGLRLGYRVHIEQRGDRLLGQGVKVSENGRPLGGRARTPITLSGSVDGDTAHIVFSERGLRRTTAGSLRWRLSTRSDTLRGVFASGAADTSGPSIARRER
jgi:penicillin-binding protein 1A